MSEIQTKEEEVVEVFEDKKGYLDTVLTKIASRKLMVWISGLVFFSIGRLDNDGFIYLSLAYIGSQALADIVTKIKGAVKE